MRGGKRAGAGRHKAPPTTLMRIRLPVAVHEAVIERGGTIWAKRLIVEAIEKLNIDYCNTKFINQKE